MTKGSTEKPKTTVAKPASVFDVKVKHGLSKYGYSSTKNQRERRESLDKAVKKDGPSAVSKKLNSLNAMTQKYLESSAKTIAKDLEYLKKMENSE